jgi:anti-anti-sigma factor
LLVSDANSTTHNGEAMRPPASRTAEPGAVHVLLGGNTTRVVLSGDIDAELSPYLVEAAAEVIEAGQPIEVDTRHVTFMDSTGVAFLARLAAASAQPPVVLSPPEEVRFLLEITRIGDLVEITDREQSSDSELPDPA